MMSFAFDACELSETLWSLPLLNVPVKNYRQYLDEVATAIIFIII
jgi:hypothetical protein